MSVLERLSAEARRGTGWAIPVAADMAVREITPGSRELVDQTTQVWYGVLGLAGVLIGLLWQWFSPRDLAERLALAGGGFLILCVFCLLPIAGEMRENRYELVFGVGIVAGLVLTTWWQNVRSPDPAEQSQDI